jgi:PI-3-kinase-related kinase SMG-1
MQLLDIINILLLQDRPSHARSLRARSYAVIPVGPRSGLIQWADGTVPLFGIYKAWQAGY